MGQEMPVHVVLDSEVQIDSLVGPERLAVKMLSSSLDVFYWSVIRDGT